MFSSPNEMYLEEVRSYRMERLEYINNLMDQYKSDALTRIGKIVDVFYAEAVALTIATAYENSDDYRCDSAIEIVNRLSLNDKHIAALLGDEKQMGDIIDDEIRQDQQDQDYSQDEGEC